MLVGLLTVTVHLQGINSLKGKRGIIKSIVQRLRSRFNLSAAEIAAHNSKQLGILGIAIISNDARHLDAQLDKIVNFLVNDGRCYIGRVHRETFTTDDEIPLY